MNRASGELLVVEDTPSSLKLLTDLLGAEGYTVRQAPDGELALWSARSRPPELILLDVRMPGIDGLEVCRQLKSSPQLRDIPVIFLSAQYDTDDKVRGFEAGAVDFIGKPYQAEEVLARTAAHIKLARTQRALAAANAELSTTLQQLRSAQTEILRAERLAALGAMVSGVAHELNTPIGNSVLTASTLAERADAFALAMQRGLRKSELDQFVADAGQAARLLLRNLEKSAALVSSFKQVANDHTNDERRQFELALMVADMAATMAGAFREQDVAVEQAVPPGIEMDSFPGALCQVFSHLGLNVLRHAFAPGATGCLRIEAECIDSARVLLRFRDNGCGIAPADLGKVFDPFFTTKLGQGSCGLGLHIAHNLVANVLGGRISVTSQPGDTCFTIELPLTAPALS